MKEISEHKTCINCKWNKYPICEGTIMFEGVFMNIENLRTNFKCGVKDKEIPIDLSSQKTKTDILEEEILELSFLI